MIRGRYLTSMDDLSAVLALRTAVFGEGADAGDEMGVYALALDHQGQMAGCGRLHIDSADQFRLDYLGVLPEKRRQGLGDLMMRMLLQRALDLNAPCIVLDAAQELQPFFSKYGFDPEQGTAMRATPQTIARCYGCTGHCGH